MTETTTDGEEQVRPPQEGSPGDLSKRSWLAGLKGTVKEIKKDRVTFTGGALAYYWFLALFPAVIALIGLVTLAQFPKSTLNSLVSGIEKALPGQAATVISQAVQRAAQKTNGGLITLIIGLAIAVWSASSGMAALTTGLNVAYDVPEDRKFLRKRLNALWLMLVAVVLGGIGAALLVFGQPIGILIQSNLSIPGSVFVWVWTVVRWAATILVVTVLFSALYYWGPKRESPKWTWVSPGSVVGTIIWLAASIGFSFYVSASGSYTETYGALAGVAILILWLYLTGLAVLIGGELNAELERQKDVQTDGATVSPSS